MPTTASISGSCPALRPFLDFVDGHHQAARQRADAYDVVQDVLVEDFNYVSKESSSSRSRSCRGAGIARPLFRHPCR